MDDLFSSNTQLMPLNQPDAYYLPGAIAASDTALWQHIQTIWQHASPIRMQTPYGLMSTYISNCGDWGWVSNTKGYRYSRVNPSDNKAWPAMPDLFTKLANEVADSCGFKDYAPNSCLINQYPEATKMGLHRDADENDTSQPIVSFSLGLSAVFKFGGKLRKDKLAKLQLNHGDVLVWGGKSRLNYHALSQILKTGNHSIGKQRLNLTFRYVNL